MKWTVMKQKGYIPIGDNIGCRWGRTRGNEKHGIKRDTHKKREKKKKW